MRGFHPGDRAMTSSMATRAMTFFPVMTATMYSWAARATISSMVAPGRILCLYPRRWARLDFGFRRGNRLEFLTTSAEGLRAAQVTVTARTMTAGP